VRKSCGGKGSDADSGRSAADVLFNCVKAAIDQSSDAGAGKTKLDVALSWLHTLETSIAFNPPPALDVVGVLLSYESPHPYPNNSDVVHQISVPGSVQLEIVFHPRCKTEGGCDYVRFVLPDGRVVGDDKYTGRGGSAHWAGVGSIPALVVEGSEVEARFHSDSSENDWGYKFTAQGYACESLSPRAMYRYSDTASCFDVLPLASPVELSSTNGVSAILAVGDRVQRGPDWIWGDQDGVHGNAGIVTEVQSGGWVMVEWDSPQSNFTPKSSDTNLKYFTEDTINASRYQQFKTFPEILEILRAPLHKFIMSEFLKTDSCVSLVFKDDVATGHRLFEILTQCLFEDSFRRSHFDRLVSMFQISALRIDLPFILDFFEHCILCKENGVSSFIERVIFDIVSKCISESTCGAQETVESSTHRAIANGRSLESKFAHLDSKHPVRVIFVRDTWRCVVAFIRRVDPVCDSLSSQFFMQTQSVCDFLLICLHHYGLHEDFQKLFDDVARCRCNIDTLAFCLCKMFSVGSDDDNLKPLYSNFSKIISQRLRFISPVPQCYLPLCAKGHVCKPWTFQKGHGYIFRIIHSFIHT
jgi:hypothetical protein